MSELAGKVAVVLSERLGTGVALRDPALVKDKTRSLVVRCRVEAMHPNCDLPTSVIVKYIRDDTVRGFSEWASLAFLAEIPETHALAPRFLGGDKASRLFVMEDLGGSTSLQDVLKFHDGPAAMTALRSMATTMGRLVTATIGREATFAALRRSLPGAEGAGRAAETQRWLADQRKSIRWWQAVNCAVPKSFAACVERIAHVYAQPGAFLCFSHGDPAPSNNHVSNGQVRLLDFEYGEFRHALYDLSAWNVLCPLPAPCVREMERCFRRELANTCPEAGDEVQYREAWAIMCAFRTLAILSWIGPEVLAENRPWVDATWTSRHAVLAAVERLHAATLGVAQLAPVCEAACVLRKALRQRWPEIVAAAETGPPWPALRMQANCE